MPLSALATPLRYNKSIFPPLLLLCCSMLVTGCAAMLAAGVGAGAFSYISGNLTREYKVQYSRAVRASSAAMKDLRFKRIKKSSDALKTTLEGQRADKTPITIIVERITSGTTRIGVRTGFVGLVDIEASKQVHHHIAKKLGSRSAEAKKKQSSSLNSPENFQVKVIKAHSKKAPQPPLTRQQEIPDITTRNTKMDNNLARPTFNNPAYIYYRKNDAGISAPTRQTLNNIAAYLVQNPGMTIDIRSYTDSQGSAETNLKISQKQATRTKQYFIKKGIGSGRITAKGYGATNFLESNTTETLRAMNRRIELHVH